MFFICKKRGVVQALVQCHFYVTFPMGPPWLVLGPPCATPLKKILESRMTHAHSTCPLRFLSQVDFECSYQKTKKLPNNIFYIWYNHTGVIRSFSAAQHQLLNSNLCSRFGWRWVRGRRVCTALHYNQSHTILLSLWMQWPIRDVQMNHHWNAVFCSLDRLRM